jgi:hypothetical protein
MKDQKDDRTLALPKLPWVESILDDKGEVQCCYNLNGEDIAKYRAFSFFGHKHPIYTSNIHGVKFH